ncbi:MAG: hypothetical protein IPO06_27640 [Leptospiraceae bacterium]|nr:hypothetical protein [Leptospiraceae bacterium]
MKPEEITSLENEFQELSPCHRPHLASTNLLCKSSYAKLTKIQELLKSNGKRFYRKERTITLTALEKKSKESIEQGKLILLETPFETKAINASLVMELDYN